MFANVLLTRYGNGEAERVIEIVDAASVFLYGRYEAYLEVGDANSEAEATARAQAALAVIATEQRDISASVIPVNASDIPYIFYVLGNDVTVYDENNALISEQVRAITITENDEDATASITLGLRQTILSPEERVARRLNRGFEGGRDLLSEMARRVLPPAT